MSKLMSLIRRAPKRFTAATLMVAAAIIVPAAVFAWGPSRPTFTGANPAPYVTFNSITDNPQVGDERNFVRIRESGTANYGDNVTLQPGKVYDVSVYFHNNAASNLNASGKGIAKDAKLKMEIPGVVNAGVNAAFTGTISASNSNPLSVWDEAYGKNSTAGQVALRYVSNSATFVSNGAINGQKLPDSLFTTGAKLGYSSQNGEVPGCNEYSGFVNFQIRVDQPNFTIKKQVSVDEGKTWVDDSVKAKAGSTVQYRVVYQNTGTTQQDNVSLRDMLPTGVSYVAGSSLMANSTTGGTYKAAQDGITTVGTNVGSYQPKGNVYFKFSAKLPTEDKLKCGTNTLVNTARATTSAGYKEDTATVVVDRECKPEAKYTCDALKVTELSRTSFRFDTTYTAQNATFKSVTYTVRNASGAVIATQTVTGGTSYTYNQSTPGSYTVQSAVTVTVDGQDKTVTSTGCKGSFKVKEEEKKITVCELATKKIVTIYEKDFNPTKYSKNLDDCKEKPPVKITVCELATKKIVVINESDFNPAKYSKNLDDCKEKKITVCELATKKIVTINESDFNPTKYSKNLDDCKEKPPVKITVCELATKKIVVINESDFNPAKYSKNLDDCKEVVKKITVCDLKTKQIVVINEKDFDSSKYSKNLDDCKEVVKKIKVCELATKTIVVINEADFNPTKYSKDLDDCKEKPPVKIEVCDLTTKQIVTINENDFDEAKYSKDLSKCEETPVTPPELPQTGAGESIVAIVGLGALIASLAYYIASRRALNQ